MMKKNGEELIKNMLGESFLEDLSKFEMINLKTDTAISHEEIADAFKVVPRVVMSWLISNLTPMSNGEAKEFNLPFSKAYGAKLAVTKIANDVYHGEAFKNGERISKFLYRSIPGIGLVLLTSFELYDVDDLIVSTEVAFSKNVTNKEQPPIFDLSGAYQNIGKMIDEKLALRDLIERVVDRKLQQQEAVKELFLIRMASEIKKSNPAPKPISSDKTEKKEKKPLKLKKFLDKKKPKLHTTALNKAEIIHCPDCGTAIFSEKKGFSGCICFGNNRNSTVTLKKTDKNVKISFSKDWDIENIEMLLKILQKRGGSNE